MRDGFVVLDNYREDADGNALPDNSVNLIEAALLQESGWFRATLEASSIEAQVTIASYDDPAASTSTSLPLLDLSANPFLFALGIPWVSQSGPLEFRYDNVVCTYRLPDDP